MNNLSIMFGEKYKLLDRYYSVYNMDFCYAELIKTTKKGSFVLKTDDNQFVYANLRPIYNDMVWNKQPIEIAFHTLYVADTLEELMNQTVKTDRDDINENSFPGR